MSHHLISRALARTRSTSLDIVCALAPACVRLVNDAAPSRSARSFRSGASSSMAPPLGALEVNSAITGTVRRAIDAQHREYSKKKAKGGKKEPEAAAAANDGNDDDGHDGDGDEGGEVAAYDPKVWQSKFDGAAHALDEELAQLRTSRASSGMIDHIIVDVYGEPTPISQLATITAPNAYTLSLTLYDAATRTAVEKAIINSPLGLVPKTTTDGLAVPIPTMTQETRKEVCKLASKLGENSKVAVRNIRHRALKQLKRADMPEDDQKRAEKHLQSMTDDAMAKVAKQCAAKEKEIMSV